MKYCENCGAELEDSAVFCEECGAKVETVSQEKTVDSERSKKIDRQDNDVNEVKEDKQIETHSSIETETSDKSIGKKKMMIPVLCGVIGVLVIAIIVMIVVMSKKSNNDGKNEKSEAITISTTEAESQNVTESKSETVMSTEATTQTTKKLTATEKLTGTWLAQEEQKGGQYTFKVSLEMTVNSVDGSNANVDLKFVRTSEGGITFIYLIKGLNANIVSGTRLEFDASKADLVLSNESNREGTTLNPFRGKTFGTGTIQIDTTDNDSIGVTILNVNFVNDNFSLMNVDMKRQ